MLPSVQSKKFYVFYFFSYFTKFVTIQSLTIDRKKPAVTSDCHTGESHACFAVTGVNGHPR